MQRLYPRVLLTKLHQTIYFFEQFRKNLYNLIKPAVYRHRLKKIIEINRKKLQKKQDIFNSKIEQKNAKTMNFIR